MTKNKIFILLLSGAFAWGSLANPEGVVNSDSEDRTPQQIKEGVIEEINGVKGNIDMNSVVLHASGFGLGIGSMIMMGAATQLSTPGIVLGGGIMAASIGASVVGYQGCRKMMRRLNQARTDIRNL